MCETVKTRLFGSESVMFRFGRGKKTNKDKRNRSHHDDHYSRLASQASSLTLLRS